MDRVSGLRVEPKCTQVFCCLKQGKSYELPKGRYFVRNIHVQRIRDFGKSESSAEFLEPSIRGVFRGIAEFDVVLIGDQQIDFYDIRHIQIYDFYKWSENEPEKPIDNSFSEVKFTGLTEENSTSMLLSMNTIVTEIFMKTYDYQGSVIKEGNKTASIAYVQCACGYLASRVSSDSDKCKCSLCKRIYTLQKRSVMNEQFL